MRLALLLPLCLVLVTQVLGQELTTFWYEYIAKQGVAPYNPQGSAYQVYRNVKDFGAKGITVLWFDGETLLTFDR